MFTNKNADSKSANAKSSSRGKLWLLIILLVVGSAGGWWYFGRSADKQNNEVPAYRYQRVERGSMISYLRIRWCMLIFRRWTPTAEKS